MFAVPALYAVIARRTRSPQYVSRLIARLRRADRDEAPAIATGPREATDA
jgi:hypothetical protein